ncbi:MAG: hypothetical protein ACYTAQ_16775 [Planctomycetota bacterium]|jgi:hypothetical protein
MISSGNESRNRSKLGMFESHVIRTATPAVVARGPLLVQLDGEPVAGEAQHHDGEVDDALKVIEPQR